RLSCGTSFKFEVDAFDAAGNHSAHAVLQASTSPCSQDQQAPTSPSSLSITGSTATSISLKWQASSDNVGVASYGLYVNGSKTGSTNLTSATFGGLSCNTTY